MSKSLIIMSILVVGFIINVIIMPMVYDFISDLKAKRRK